MYSIIFDLDNTLTHRADTINCYANVFQHDFKTSMKNDYSFEHIANLLVRHDNNGYAGHNRRSKNIRDSDIWRTRPSIEDLIDHWQAWIPRNPSPMPGLMQVLEHFKNSSFSLGIITNGSAKAQRKKIEALNIDNYFTSILISEETGFQKPEKAIFDLALAELQADRKATYFIGDHPSNDYAGAFNAGLIPIWLEGFVDWPNHLPRPKHHIQSLAKCIDLIDTLTLATM
ncbi:HAD family hydrolase [Aurantivibrio plasticivorans]